MPQENFAGDKKAPMVSPLAGLEKKLVSAWVPHFPKAIETYHLTALTILWSVGMVLFGWLAQRNLHWLWGASFMLFMQWFTDTFDGALGRYRNTGLIKWGFYADHFLDFIFMATIFVGYAFIMPTPTSQFLVLLFGFIYECMMAHSFLDFAITNEFKITYLGTGPTEIRLYFIIINTAMIIWGVGWFAVALPYICIATALMLAYMVWCTHKNAWAIDMENKK